MAIGESVTNYRHRFEDAGGSKIANFDLQRAIALAKIRAVDGGKEGDAPPIVSIILPVYGAEKFLPACLQSICDQSFSDFECICVDDGSPDGCGKILDAMAEKDGRFRVLHLENCGVGRARNAGMDVAKGEWIAFVDADDLLHRDYLKILHHNLLTFHADVSLCSYRRIRGSRCLGEDRRCRPVREGRIYLASAEPRAFQRAVKRRDVSYGVVWGKLFRREILLKQRFSDIPYGEDALFVATAMFFRPAQVLSRTPLYFYRIHPQSTCGQMNYENTYHNTMRCASELHNFFTRCYLSLSSRDALAVERTIASVIFKAFLGNWRLPGFWTGHRRMRSIAAKMVNLGELQYRRLSIWRRIRLWLYVRGCL
ncbi:MAG: glycosyltransferase [Puniceicoccales bacterium]|jgi:glycosyltransferase involved in cell wall biosynthesis|nr:glycosyltransferase [Puniceicoccales bacterium]